MISHPLAPLSELPTGSVGRVCIDGLSIHSRNGEISEERALLEALGLTDGSLLRVCRQGEPCIVEVRSTRIGLARQVAERIYVTSPGAAHCG